jgi:hypothetical protein
MVRSFFFWGIRGLGKNGLAVFSWPGREGEKNLTSGWTYRNIRIKGNRVISLLVPGTENVRAMFNISLYPDN